MGEMIKMTERGTAAPERPLPAYCDPNNELKGSKFERGRDVKDVAKDVRAWIKKNLPGVKASVTINRYSGGCSLDVTVKALPCPLINPDEAMNRKIHEHDIDRWALDHYTAEAREILDKIAAEVRAHKRDNSDSMADYFDVNFYDSVTVHWEYEKAENEAALLRWVG